MSYSGQKRQHHDTIVIDEMHDTIVIEDSGDEVAVVFEENAGHGHQGEPLVAFESPFKPLREIEESGMRGNAWAQINMGNHTWTADETYVMMEFLKPVNERRLSEDDMLKIPAGVHGLKHMYDKFKAMNRKLRQMYDCVCVRGRVRPLRPTDWLDWTPDQKYNLTL